MSSKFLDILSDKVVINKNKLNIDTSGLGLDKNKGYDISFSTGIIKDINNKDISNIDSFKMTTGETPTSETGSTGSTGGTSPTVIIPGVTLLVSGRQIYRHESDEASVLVFDRYGTEVHLLIPDCKYRTSSLYWGTYKTDTAAPNINTTKNKNDTWYINGESSEIAIETPVPVITDAQLQDLYPQFSTDLSAKELCDIWMTYQGITDSRNITGVPVVEYARTLTIPGITGVFDVPNMYELMVMFLEQEAIDNLDKYKSDPTYQNYLLAYNSSNKRWFNNGYVWAASEYNYHYVWRMGCRGEVMERDKTGCHCVAPVQELSF